MFTVRDCWLGWPLFYSSAREYWGDWPLFVVLLATVRLTERQAVDLVKSCASCRCLQVLVVTVTVHCLLLGSPTPLTRNKTKQSKTSQGTPQNKLAKTKQNKNKQKTPTQTKQNEERRIETNKQKIS